MLSDLVACCYGDNAHWCIAGLVLPSQHREVDVVVWGVHPPLSMLPACCGCTCIRLFFLKFTVNGEETLHLEMMYCEGGGGGGGGSGGDENRDSGGGGGASCSGGGGEVAEGNHDSDGGGGGDCGVGDGGGPIGGRGGGTCSLITPYLRVSYTFTLSVVAEKLLRLQVSL